MHKMCQIPHHDRRLRHLSPLVRNLATFTTATSVISLSSSRGL